VRLAAEHVEKTSPPPFVITAKQMKRYAKRSSKVPVYLVQIDHAGKDDPPKLSDSASQATEIEIGGSSVSKSVPLKGKTAKHAPIEEFSHNFPDDLPHGLPPKRSFHLKIDLLPDAKPVKRPMYKLSDVFEQSCGLSYL
jgi:hypothetical protein